MKILSTFIALNRLLSKAFDIIMPKSMCIYGTTDFHVRLLPKYLQDNWKVYDIGGGKRPFINKEEKQTRNITLVGVDIDEKELRAAPADTYDETLTADITSYRGKKDGNMVMSRSTLEHVKDTPASIEGMASFLKKDGIILAFCPCKNAAFAKLNLLVPEAPKNALLHALYGEQAKVMGFKAYYDNCTPSAIEKIAKDNNLEVVEKTVYWMSNYFMVFTPLHIVWRLYQLVVKTLGLKDLCEGQAFVLRKK